MLKVDINIHVHYVSEKYYKMENSLLIIEQLDNPCTDKKPHALCQGGEPSFNRFIF